MTPRQSPSAPTPRPRRQDRRVPKEQRRRAAVSCDHCKLKRNKCTRDSNDDTAPCVGCRNAGIVCQYTIPRKRRVSSDVPGRRKYEYVDVSVHASETAVDDRPSSSGSNRISPVPSSTPQLPLVTAAPPSSSSTTSTPTVSTVINPSMPLLSSSTMSMSGGYQAPSSSSSSLPSLPPPLHHHPHHHQPQPQPQQHAPVVEDAFRYELDPVVLMPPTPPRKASSEAPHQQLLSAGANETASRPVTGAGSQFASKLRHFGVHGSYSFLVQVQSLFALALGEDHSKMLPPQTMGPGFVMPEMVQSSLLPDRSFADTLVDTYFNTFHNEFPVLHRDSFYSVYETMWHSGTQLPSPWLVCIYLVFAFGAEKLQAVHHQNVEAGFQNTYAQASQGLITQVLMTGSSLVDIQALLMYSLYLFFDGQRDSSWNLLGAAVRIALAIGMHRGDAGFKLDPIESELRKRVWWTMYCFERLECSFLGRPSSIDDYDCTVEYPRQGILDTAPALEYTIMHAQIGLYTILGTISKRFSMLDMASSEALAAAGDLYQRLMMWRNNLPDVVAEDQNNTTDSSSASPVSGSDPYLTTPGFHRRRYITMAIYHYTVCFLCRPFLVQLATAGRAPLVSYDEGFLRRLAGLCTSSSIQCQNYLHRLHSKGLFDYRVGLDIYLLHYTSMVFAVQALVHIQLGERSNLSVLRDYINANDYILDKYPEPSRTMARLAQVSYEVSKVVRDAISKYSLEEGGQFLPQPWGDSLTTTTTTNDVNI